MPSWYNLFLATGAVLCILQFATARGKEMRWLLFAGLCCGVSIIIKITGVYALAAALLACVYLVTPQRQQQKSTNRGYLIFVAICLLVFLFVFFCVLGERANLNAMFA